MNRFHRLAIVGVVVAAVAVANAAWGAGTDGGGSVIIDPATSTALASGGSTTEWTFKLPAPTADRCSGDSATGGFRVESYITPVANNPADLTFSASDGPNQPAGSFAAPLFDSAGSPYIAQNTANTTGQVKDFPGVHFNFARFSVSGAGGTIALPLGQYNVGIACRSAAGTDKFWNTKLTFVSSTTDPSGETWTQAASGTTTTTAAGATTSTTRASTGSTTSTTRASTTSTTSANGATTTSTTSATGATTSTTRAASVAAASSGSGASNLPRSGRSVGPQIVLAGFLLYVGALVLTIARRQHWASRLMAYRR